VFRYGIVAVVLLMALWLFTGLTAWSSGLSSSDTLTLALEPMSGSSILAAYGILAATILSLQVGVFEFRMVGGRRALLRSAGSRALLSNLSDASGLGALAIGLLVVVWSANEPDRLDVLRTLGPGIVSIGLALVAADAAIIAAPFPDADFGRLARASAIERLEAVVASLPGHALGRAQRLRQLAVLLVVAPALLAGIAQVILPADSLGRYAVRVLVIVVVTIIAGFAVGYVVSPMLERTGLDWLWRVVPLFGIGIIYHLGFLTTYLRPTSTGALDLGHLAAGMLLGSVIFIGPIVVVGIFARPPRAGHPRPVVLDLVALRLQRRLMTMRRRSAAQPREPLNRLVVAALWTFPVLPFGALAASYALVWSGPLDRRNRLVALAVLWASIVGLVFVFAVAIVFASGAWVLNWCDSSRSWVCFVSP
jgi:hypothetical protein